MDIERALPAFHAIKTLISYNYYDADTFWAIWNRPNYAAVKRLTDPQNLFRDLYVKTCRAARGLDEGEAAPPSTRSSAPPEPRRAP